MGEKKYPGWLPPKTSKVRRVYESMLDRKFLTKGELQKRVKQVGILWPSYFSDLTNSDLVEVRTDRPTPENNYRVTSSYRRKSMEDMHPDAQEVLRMIEAEVPEEPTCTEPLPEENAISVRDDTAMDNVVPAVTVRDTVAESFEDVRNSLNDLELKLSFNSRLSVAEPKIVLKNTFTVCSFPGDPHMFETTLRNMGNGEWRNQPRCPTHRKMGADDEDLV